MSKAWDAFTNIDTSNDPYCLSWASQGWAGSGKTRFILTAPEPIWIAVFNDPGGVSRLVKQNPEFRKKDIRWKEYTFSPGGMEHAERGAQAREVWEEFTEDYRTALKHARTTGWDKEDEVWELLRYAKLEHYTDKPASYYELNLEMANLIHEAAAAGVNLGIVRGLKETWGQNAKGSPVSTGKFEPRGWKLLDEKVLVVLEHYFDEDERVFQTKFGEKCRVGPATELIGKVNADLDFETLAMLLYPETAADMSVWGL